MASTLVWCAQVFWFLFTGFWMSVGVQEIVYAGADDIGLVMFGYVALMPFIACIDRHMDLSLLRYLIAIGVLETVASVVFALGLTWAGSSYHTVIYASLTAVTALLRRILLGRSITWLQWVSIAIVLTGLVLTVDAAGGVEKTASDPADDNLAIGIVMSLVCVVVMSLLYIAMEFVQTMPSPPHALTMTWVVGTVEVVLTAVYCAVAVVPNWNERVTLKMKNAQDDASLRYIVLMFVSIAVSYSTHMISFVWIIGRASDGGVFVGMLQGVRVIFVIVYGGVFLCRDQTSQCFSTLKGVACLFVVGGVLLFTKAKELRAWWYGDLRTTVKEISLETERLLGDDSAEGAKG